MRMYQIVEHRNSKHYTWMMAFNTDVEMTHWMNGYDAMHRDEHKNYGLSAWSIDQPKAYIDFKRFGYIDGMPA